MLSATVPAETGISYNNLLGAGTSDKSSSGVCLSDAEISARLLKILEEVTPKWYHNTALPCRIEFVDE